MYPGDINMASVSLLPTRHQNIQMEGCPIHLTFYHCGNFRGCCPVDPCSFQKFTDPCDAAIAALEGQGDGGDGDDDGHDGGDDEVASTTRHTPSLSSSTRTSRLSTTDNPGTFTSLSNDNTSSSANPSPTSSIEASTTVNDITLTFSVGSTASTGLATETLSVLAPTSTPQGESHSVPLPKAAIAGASVAGIVGGVAFLVLVFWLLRRRRLSKRMSSIRGDSPKPLGDSDEKSIIGRHHSLTGTALGIQNMFAEPDGRVLVHQPLHQDMRQDEGWPLTTPDSTGPGFYQDSRTADTGSRPFHAELDSGPGAGASASIPLNTLSPNTVPPPSRRPSPFEAQTHPSQLTPGWPGTPMVMQNQPRSADSGQNRHNLDSAPRDAPRATLNATDDERMNNLYVNSWAHGP